MVNYSIATNRKSAKAGIPRLGREALPSPSVDAIASDNRVAVVVRSADGVCDAESVTQALTTPGIIRICRNTFITPGSEPDPKLYRTGLTAQNRVYPGGYLRKRQAQL